MIPPKIDHAAIGEGTPKSKLARLRMGAHRKYR